MKINVVSDSLLRPVHRWASQSTSSNAPCVHLKTPRVQKRSILQSSGARSYTNPKPKISSATQRQRNSPLLTAFFTITVFGAISFVGLKVYDRYYGPKSPFPPEVEEKLRKAIHHSEIVREPELSFTEFQEALQLADSVGMNKWSDEYMGIRIRMIEMLEKYGILRAAVTLYLDFAYEAVLYAMKDMSSLGLISAEKVAKLPVRVPVARTATIKEVVESDVSGLPSLDEVEPLRNEVLNQLRSGMRPTFDIDVASRQRERQRVYGNLLGVLNNLGTFLLSLNDGNQAFAVYTSLLGWYAIFEETLSPFGDHDTLLTPRQQAAIWDSIATAVFHSDLPHHQGVSADLWNRALRIFRETNGDQPTCEEVTLLSNMAMARSGYSSKYEMDITELLTASEGSPSALSPSSSSSASTSLSNLEIPDAEKPDNERISKLSPSEIEREIHDAVASARQISLTAVKLSQNIKPPIRTDECDMGCLAALEHLAHLAELVGNFKVAKDRLLEAKQQAKGMQPRELRPTPLSQDELDTDERTQPSRKTFFPFFSWFNREGGSSGAGVIENAVRRLSGSSSSSGSQACSNRTAPPRPDTTAVASRTDPYAWRQRVGDHDPEKAQIALAVRSGFLAMAIQRFDARIELLEREMARTDDDAQGGEKDGTG